MTIKQKMARRSRAPNTTVAERGAWAAEGPARRQRIEATVAGCRARLLALMAAHGTTWTELGLRIGGHPLTVFHWKQGTRLPDSLSLALIADVFGCSVDFLLGVAPEESEQESA